MLNLAVGKETNYQPGTYESENFNSLKARLNSWVFERIKTWSPKLMEAKARWVIAQAIIKDINQPNYPQKLVVSRTEKSRNYLIKRGVTSETPIIIANADSLHPEEEFQTIFRRDDKNKFWIAEELNMNGIIISQAGIGDHGDTMLTITPHGNRFLNANPNIVNQSNLPRATIATFNLLTESLKNK